MTIGVLGAGQLGRMLALAGYPLGMDFLFLDQGAGTPAHQVAPSLLGSFSDPALLAELAGRCRCGASPRDRRSCGRRDRWRSFLR
jgi:5-(carboxyamino)imidazole ribonucleotide synthase